jgi:hypothetical protein
MSFIRRILNLLAGSFDEVVTKSLVVRDQKGLPRVHIGTAPDNSAALTLRDQNGTVRAALSMAGDERPALDLFDSVGRARVTIIVGLDGTPVVNLKDEQETLCVSLMVGKGGPLLLLSRPGGGRVNVAVPGRTPEAMTVEEQLALTKRIAETESSAAVEDVVLSSLGYGPNVIELREENGELIWGAPNVSNDRAIEKSINVTKLDAATRQLETAIRLYFHDEDPVSIHTLVGASYNIIRDINRKRGGPPMLIKDDLIELYVKTEYQQAMRKKLNEPENFFKHADRDHAETIEFNPDASEFMILDAVRGYSGITGEWAPLFRVLYWWVITANESIIKAEFKEKLAATARAARSIGKTKFFEMMLPAAMRIPSVGRPQESSE